MKKSPLFFLALISLGNVVVAFWSSWLLHDIFYSDHTARFRSSRVAPAIGILQILLFQVAVRRQIRLMGPETREQEVAADFFSGLGASFGLGLGVIIADMVRSVKKE